MVALLAPYTYSTYSLRINFYKLLLCMKVYYWWFNVMETMIDIILYIY